MVREAPSLQYSSEKRIATSNDVFSYIAEMRKELAKVSNKTKKLEAQNQTVESLAMRLEFHRQSHLDLRQRVISTWLRDVLDKETPRRKKEICTLDKEVIYGGDVRSDAMVVTERYKKSSNEWQAFRTLYGITPDNVNDLDQHKCHGSLQALNRAASILLRDSRKSFPTQTMEKRESLVAMLLEKKYEEAEKMSSTFLCGYESSVAEE